MGCGACYGRGHRVIATISGPDWVVEGKGRATLARSFAIPLVVSCLGTAERAADHEDEAYA